MTTDTAQTAAVQAQAGALGTGTDIVIRVRAPVIKPDFATILGVVLTLLLIGGAISMGNSNASFLDIPSILIVILGTVAATSISYTGQELKHVFGIVGNTLFRKYRKPSTFARQLMDIATLARKKGVLILSGLETELRKDPLIVRGVRLVTDGYGGEDIDRVLGQELDSLIERHRRAANILRRASEIAPAMGLIGTLVGLVQMLSALDNPDAIGPAMAVALLTTFYGAILGMIILAPLAGKLERNSNDEALMRTLVMTAMGSIARQENPRRLEMLLNTDLPPEHQIEYFD